MNTDSKNPFKHWEYYSWLSLGLGLGTIIHTVYSAFVNGVELWMLTTGYVAFIFFALAFCLRYAVWYYSDAAVIALAKRAKNWFGRDWIDNKLNEHPRKKEIIQEYERLIRQ